MNSRSAIEAFIAQPALALAGMSRSGKKFGNVACRELINQGYRVFPLHPSAEIIDGQRCYRSFSELPEHVDAVLVVVPPAQAVAVVRDALAAGVHHVWLQQGAESPQALQVCRDAGLEAVSGECVLMFAHPAGIHKAHRWLWQLLGRIPA
jgi:predicted CoA-binding protein